jgi:hypothetical protein
MASFLKMHQQQNGNKASDMQAIRGRIKSDIAVVISFSVALQCPA